jgi:tetratricopeptide (TPR) repeat protein
MAKFKGSEAKALPTPKGREALKPAAEVPPPTVAPLFRRVDWLTFGITTVIVWTVYLLTLAPELTLKDSGELVTGSVYAGIPHPPGYPVWTIYSHLWTLLLPVGNYAWRVSVGQSLAAAIACGLLAFLVSRGSSLLMEGIEDLKGVTGKWENAICLVSGLVAGLLMGFDAFMWGESVVVNRIALFSVPWLMLVLVCLLRWIYAPHQMRYAYTAAFLFGVCFTTHQSLIVAALAFEVAIAMGNPRLGRDAFFGNFLIYLFYLVMLGATGKHIFSNIGAKPGLWVLFNAVGVSSLLASLWLAVRTKGLGGQLPRVFLMAGLWVLGISFFLYMPISGMTNPPMQWGYPRTVEGFWHALSRGQYEQPNPTNLLQEPGRFLGQLAMLIGGVAEEFTWMFIFVALVPLLFLRKMQKRERAWIISLAAMYLCLGVLLTILLNPTPDLATAELIKVFLTSSHTIVVCFIGYGLALVAAFMATHYSRFRIWGIIGGTVSVILAVFSLWEITGKHFFGPDGRVSILHLPKWVATAANSDYFGLPVLAGLLLLGIVATFLAAVLFHRSRAPVLITLCLFTLTPVYSLVSHWHKSEQRGHWFGYWFGHDMFSPTLKDRRGDPIYPEMTKDAILFGGTDPGRFCPTYMIFCESFTPHDCQPSLDQKFDRRDVYIITQNALADGTYLNYIRAHYNRSTQIDPPFFSELARTTFKDKDYETNLLARLVSPLDRIFTARGQRIEKRRRTYTSWFSESDFVDLAALVSRLRPNPDQDGVSRFVYEALSKETREALAGPRNEAALKRALAADLNLLLERELKPAATPASALWDATRFQGVAISEYLQDFIRQNPRSDTRIRLNRLLLEAAYPREIARSIGGVYPDREIYIPTPADSSRCYQEYMIDAGRRFDHDRNFPNEPRQIRPGENVNIIGDQVQISGTVAVMSINAYVAKVIFDQNPKNDFFVEESLPLDWMYPHLTPFGIIMKVNRKPLATLSEEVLRRDHEYWKAYAKRLTGDFIDYDTSIQQVADWIEKTYLRHNWKGFTGDRKFLRDQDAQKAFSKLRSSIAGVYVWRLGPQCPPEYRPKTPEEYQRILKEAEFAFRQAFAFCPYSPEAVFRYVNLLIQFNRFEEALVIARTCAKLDPFNGQVRSLATTLETLRNQQGAAGKGQLSLQQMEAAFWKQPTNLQIGFDLASVYVQMQMTDKVEQVFDALLSDSNVQPMAVLSVARAYSQIRNWKKMEGALEKLVKIAPDNAENWYDLAAFKSSVGKVPEALAALERALDLSAKRLRSNPKASDLLPQARADARFKNLHESPEYKKLVGQ